jgi:alcohol dehydrogenase class IV
MLPVHPLPPQLLLPGRTLAAISASLKIGAEGRAFGKHGVLVHGRSLERGDHLTAILAAAPGDVTITPYLHAGSEPTLDEVEQLRTFLRAASCDWVAAVGGGSVIDLAKAAAGLLHAPESVAVYQAGAAIPPATLPLIAAPTTAGTGSEATVVAVLTDPRCELKQSIRHPSFMPRVVILDHQLLYACPAATLAASGMDAFVQAFESFTSRYATPFTRSLSELALVRIAQALLPMYRGDTSQAADLLQGSYLAGVALSHARLGVVHGLAHPLGSRWHVAHGLACAVCMPAALRFNSPVIGADLAHLRHVLGRDIADIVTEWTREMQLVSPFTGQIIRDREAIIKETLASGSTGANPRPVVAADVEALLAEIFNA